MKTTMSGSGIKTQLVILSLLVSVLQCSAFPTPTPAIVSVSRLSAAHCSNNRTPQQQCRSRNTDLPSDSSSSTPSSPITNNSHNRERTLLSRRSFATSALASLTSTILAGNCLLPGRAFAEEGGGGGVTEAELPPVEVVLTGDLKRLFNEGIAREGQGNIPAAVRIYQKVTKIAPRFIYGWSNLGNTQIVLGDLQNAEESYTTAINLCQENRKEEERFGIPRCNDYYLLLLNRGTLRLNNANPQQALADLELAASLRGKPDPLILQNRARARELNGLYGGADADYNLAISMTAGEVTPLWLRSAMVKYQLGDLIGAMDLARRVETKFPEAPEVRAALAALLTAKGDEVEARRKLLEMPERQRLKYAEDEKFLKEVVVWPPKMIESLGKLTKAIQVSGVDVATSAI